jgi:hypothetical protein
MKNILFLIIAVLFDSIICSAQYTHTQTGWTFSTSMNQCFYMFKPVHINGSTPNQGTNNGTTTNNCPTNNCDVVASFVKKTINSGPNINTDTMVCTGWAYFVMDNSGYHTVYSAGNDMFNIYYYADMGDSVYFKIYQASSGIIYDTKSTMPVPSWTSNMMNNIILLDTLQTNTTLTGYKQKTDSEFYFNIYPNPANNTSIINIGMENAFLNVYDISGKQCNALKVQSEIISISNLELDNGLYFIRISNNERVITKRLIINN